MLSWVVAFAGVKLPVLKYMPTKFMTFSDYSAQGCITYGRLKFVWWPSNIRGYGSCFVSRFGAWIFKVHQHL